MKRPTGIALIAVMFIVLAVLSLLWSGLVFGLGGLGSLSGGLFGADNVAALGASSAWSGFVGILSALVQIAVAIGLLVMRRWAWFLAPVRRKPDGRAGHRWHPGWRPLCFHVRLPGPRHSGGHLNLPAPAGQPAGIWQPVGGR